MTNHTDIFYVYILFDHYAIPRYVGKGKGNRWLMHEQQSDPNNQLKNEFLDMTWRFLGEIPKIKIQENMLETDAFDLEKLLIQSIGRVPNGPLVNRTDNRNGPSSETIKAWHASRTAKERSASAKKSKATDKLKRTPNEISKRARLNALSEGSDILSKRMAAMQAARTQEERSAAGRKGGQTSNSHFTPEERSNKMLQVTINRWAETTPEQRYEHGKKTFGKMTKEQLSAYGKKGITTANAKRTPEERVALAKKARAAVKMTREERSARMKAIRANQTTERKQEIAKLGMETKARRELKRQNSTLNRLPPVICNK